MIHKEIFFENDRVLIINNSIFQTRLIKPESIDLVITSPPYNVDIKYNSHDDQISYEKYQEFSEEWMTCCYNWLKDDGRFCLNIPLDKNKGGQQSVGADLTTIAKKIGFNYHSTIIWNEGNISRRTAWGSWLSASAPFVIAPVELIVVLYKNTWKKTSGSKVSDILRQDFMDWTNGLWSFGGESKKKIGHPAPFPVELPRRCMKLFSYKGDTVLDPFLGSGTTLVASYLNDRKGIGIDIDPHYCKIALDRLKKEGGMDQSNNAQHVTPTTPKPKNRKPGATKTDTISPCFKDNPSGIDPPVLKPGPIAPCGMNCALCLAFQRDKKKCPGCREDDPDIAKSRQSCIIRNCPTIRNNSSHFCYECEKMPCKRLKQLDTRYRTRYGMSMIANLTEIKDQGIDAFLAHQTDKYTCRTCQGLLCVHRSRCLTCDP